VIGLIVGEASVVVKYDSGGSAAELEAKTNAELAGLSDGATVAGTRAGEDLRTGVKEGASGLENDLGAAGALGGVQLREGVGKEAEGLAGDLGKVGADGGEKLATGMSSKAGILASALGALGVPMGGIGDKAEKMGTSVEKGGLSISHLASNAGVSEGALLGVAGGLAVVVAGAVDLGLKMQEATDKVAQSAQISDGAAKKISDAFTGMAGHSEADGAALATAYASVAGQLGSVEGKALTAGQAVKVMTAAQNLGEATSTTLASATSSLASVMQAYQVPVKNAAAVSDQLYVASQRTGLGVAGLSAAVAKVKTGLGAMSPPISQVNGLLVDMADHGETGRKGLSLLTTSMTTLVKPAADMAKAQNALKTATDALPPSLKSLAAQYSSGQMTSTQLTAATKGLSTSQATLFSAFTTAAKGMDTAKQKSDALGFSTVDAQGKFIGIGPVLGKLHDQIKGMSDEQATAKLSADGFGSSAAKLLTIVRAGPTAFDNATHAVTKHGAAAEAAAKQQHTMAGEMKTLETVGLDLGFEIGGVLVPALTDVASVGVSVVKFVTETPPLMYALGAAVGIGLAIPVARFAANTAKDFIGSLASAGTGIVNFGAKMLGQEPVFAATQSAEEQTAATFKAAAESMSSSAAQIAESMTTVGTAAGTMAGEIEGQTNAADASLAGTGAAANAMAADVAAGMATTVGEVTTADATIEAENAAAGLSFTAMLGPVGIVAGGIGLLAGAFGLLSGSENTEVDAAKAVTSAKKAEASAISDANNATYSAENAYFAVKSAQEQVRSSQEALSAAIKKYGSDSSQAKGADEQLKSSKLQLFGANQQLAQQDATATAANAKAISGAKEQADALDKLIAVKKQDVATAEQQLKNAEAEDTGNNKDVHTTQDVTDARKALKGATDALSGAEQQRNTQLTALSAASATAQASELNMQRAAAGTTQIVGAQAVKVSGLSSIYTQLPKNVQTKIASDTTDATEKIGTLVTSLKQQGIGTPTIAKILGDSSNAQQAITQLTAKLNSIPPEFRTAGQQSSQGFTTGVLGGIPAAEAAGTKLGLATAAATKAAVKAKSPSQVFHDIGINIGDGLAEGIDASHAKVKTAAQNLVTVGGKSYSLPNDLANTPTVSTLEATTGKAAKSTLADAKAAPSSAMVTAEQAWVTAAQTVVTNLTNTATSQAAKVTKDSSALSSAASKVKSDSGTLKTAAAKVATDSASGASKTEKAGLASAEAAVKQDSAALKLAQAADATKAAASKVAASAEATDKKREAIASSGQAQLNTIMSAIASGSQATLNSTMSGITEKQMTTLVGKLDATHSKALQGIASKIETTWKQGVDALALANEIAANTTAGTLATDVANASAKQIADQQAVADDATTGASAQQTQLDKDTQSSDQTIGDDQQRLDQATPGSLAASQDQLALTARERQCGRCGVDRGDDREHECDGG
jgi:hypothetical protein